jgi:hypothetical protein
MLLTPIFRQVPARTALISMMLCSLLVATGCTERSKRVLFDGKYYPTRERGIDKSDRHAFQVTVRRVAQGVEQAREAGRHGGSKYCIKNFGTSEIEWERGPDDDVALLLLDNGTMVLTGRCVTW